MLTIWQKDPTSGAEVVIEINPFACRGEQLIAPHTATLQSFVDNGDGTITDIRTGLTWTKDNVGSGKMDYAGAEKACKELTLAGRKWDFPSRAELLTLVDDTRHNPAIDTAAFPNCASDWYWSKTPTPWAPSCVFVVYFNGGGVLNNGRYDEAFLRAVSRAPAGQ